MKTIFVKCIFLGATALLFIVAQACKQSEKKKDQVQTELHDDVHDHDGAHDTENDAADRLVLNNGVKWQADEPTNKNAKIIISIGDQFLENENRTLKEYQAFGKEVSEAINTMIRECTMKGEADMALHFWFAPLMQNAHTLKEATDTKGLKNIASKMIDRMHMYPKYFE